MKKTLMVFAILLAVSFAFGQSIINYWNFNVGTPPVDTNWTQPIAATQGTGQISYTFTEAYSFGGTPINGIDGEVNGGSFAPRGGLATINNGESFTISGSTVGFGDIVISFAARKTGTGFTQQEVMYTINGTDWVTKEIVSLVGWESNWLPSQVVTVDFTDIAAVNNNANFAVRFVLTGATSDVGNDRIDNVKMIGSSQSGVATPTFTPPAGVYTTTQNVAITTSTPDATIYYTTTGAEPTTSSTVYSAPIAVSASTTLKAKAYATGLTPSLVATAAYAFPVVVSNLTQLRQQVADNSTIYQVSSPVILAYKQSNKNQKYVQDAGAAILILDEPGVITTNYAIGDGISGLSGKLSLYFETLQFLPAANPGPATSTGNAIPTPTVTVAQLNGDVGVGAYQSRLVRVNDLHFASPAGNYATNPAVSTPIFDPTGEMIFRTAFYDANYIGTPMHTGNFNMLGLITHYQSTVQITPRMLTDFNPPSANDDPSVTPVGANLIGNYPNPFNPETTISFSLDKSAPAEVVIYNQKGQIVKNYSLPMAAKGITNLQWNGKDDNGLSVSSGVYYFRLKSGSYSSTKKMVLMK